MSCPKLSFCVSGLFVYIQCALCWFWFPFFLGSSNHHHLWRVIHWCHPLYPLQMVEGAIRGSRVISCMAKWMDFRNILEQTSFDPSPATRTIFYPIYHNKSNPSAEITWCLRNVLMISLIFCSFTRHQCGIVVLLGILQDRSGLELSWSCGTCG
jgi:hypothetical protein